MTQDLPVFQTLLLETDGALHIVIEPRMLQRHRRAMGL